VHVSVPPVALAPGVVQDGGAPGAKSTPRKTVFAGAVARVVAVLPEPVSITFIKVLEGAPTFVVA